MPSIIIKHIGPLVDTGLIELKKVNVFIGRQSTGKSTLMKILCFCKWIEKTIVVKGENTLSNYTHYSRFIKELMQFHRINSDAFSKKSEIHYSGDFLEIDLVGNGNVKINRLPAFFHNRRNSKLCFIPSERNLVSALRNIDRSYRTNDFDVLFNHVLEWGDIRENYTEESPVNLDLVADMRYYYDPKSGDVLLINGGKERISPFYASSGVQSVLPIMVMVDYLTAMVFNKSAELNRVEINDLLRILQDKELSVSDSGKSGYDITKELERYRYSHTDLFVEEPEQNLFPESQRQLINYIISAINKAALRTGYDTSFTLTTHSPYVITALNVLLRTGQALEVDAAKAKEVIDGNVSLSINDISAFYIEQDGTLTDIKDEELYMLSGIQLDSASDIVEEKLCRLNDIIYGE